MTNLTIEQWIKIWLIGSYIVVPVLQGISNTFGIWWLLPTKKFEDFFPPFLFSPMVVAVILLLLAAAMITLPIWFIVNGFSFESKEG